MLGVAFVNGHNHKQHLKNSRMHTGCTFSVLHPQNSPAHDFSSRYNRAAVELDYVLIASRAEDKLYCNPVRGTVISVTARSLCTPESVPSATQAVLDGDPFPAAPRGTLDEQRELPFSGTYYFSISSHCSSRGGFSFRLQQQLWLATKHWEIIPALAPLCR